jgi:hypothetical protein
MKEEGEGFPRAIATAFYAFLLVLGIVFYIAWGIVFDTWDVTRPENIGVYALTVILVGFGLVGFFLYSRR